QAMWWRKKPEPGPAKAAEGGDKPAPPKSKRRRRPIRWLFRKLIFTLLWLGLLLLIARPFMPRALRWYVNRTLDRSQLYRGKIGPIDVHLWRGAYTIHDVRLNKIVGE